MEKRELRGRGSNPSMALDTLTQQKKEISLTLRGVEFGDVSLVGDEAHGFTAVLPYTHLTEYEFTKEQALDARLQNAERAISYLAGIAETVMPVHAQKMVLDMMSDYTSASEELGSKILETSYFVRRREVSKDGSMQEM